MKELLKLVQSLSTSSSQPLHSERKIQRLLAKSGIIKDSGQMRSQQEYATDYERELEWFFLSKAALQVHGLVINKVLDRMTPLDDHLWYWDEILDSYFYSRLYTLQTTPFRWFGWARIVYETIWLRLERLEQRRLSIARDEDVSPHRQGIQPVPAARSLRERWQIFHHIVRESIAEKALNQFDRRIMTSIALCRAQVRENQKWLRAMRTILGSGLGMLVEEGFLFSDDKSMDLDEWKAVTERSVALLEHILDGIMIIDRSERMFEDQIFQSLDEEPETSIDLEGEERSDRAALLACRLLKILEIKLPEFCDNCDDLMREHGKPSRLVRWWLPVSALLLSSTAIFRILSSHRKEIITWAFEVGVTARDFWFNWVVTPIRKVIGTIRHDANSEIAIMSRDSLRADRESLERMVVDFSLDRRSIAADQPGISELQIAEIRTRVQEGDVTPVLRAYERDLRRPFMGAIKGDLVRSLLIQVQKTKVDLEVALDGIDALLKSQELVFGFVGLTPGLLVSVGLWRYLAGVFGGRRGLSRSKRVTKSIMILHHIDKILTEAPTDQDQHRTLSFKDHGLLLCEVNKVRKMSKGLLPRDIERNYLKDLEDVSNHASGLNLQTTALNRIRKTYGKWLGC